jgi:hypothetical protein
VLTTTETYDDTALAALIAAATVLGTDLKAGLYTNVLAPSKTHVIGDFVEPTYTGYARQSVVLGTPFRDPNNGIVALAASLAWFMTGTPVPTIVQGIFYSYGAGPALLGMEPFDAPISLNDDLDAFTTLLEYIQSSQNQGFTTIVR